MDRREFFASSFLPLATIPAKAPEQKSSTLVCDSKSSDCVFVVTEDQRLIDKISSRYTYFVDRKAFDKVREWLTPRKEHFVHALNTLYKGQQGTCIYAEENWPDQIVAELVKQTGLKHRQISNALCVFESDPNLLDDTK